MSTYYGPDGRPMTFEEYRAARKGEAWAAERLFTKVSPDCAVSTVWLGLDHGFDPDGPPITFETLIFGGPLDQEMWRYATRDQAHAGHDHAVRMARAARAAEFGTVYR